LYLSVHSCVSQPTGAGGAVNLCFFTGDRCAVTAVDAVDAGAGRGAAGATTMGFGAAEVLVGAGFTATGGAAAAVAAGATDEPVAD
jgi:hypothetical protein